MAFVVLPATIPDITSLYDVYFAAFDDQLINQVLFPQGTKSEEFRKTHSAHTLQWWHTAGLQHTFKCVDTTTGQIVGMAIWDVFWRERTDEERKKPWIGWLEGKERERAEGFLASFWEQREKFIGKNKHVYCQVVAVHPDHQRKGVGKLLMEWGIRAAEQMIVPLYLEATHTGVPLYKKIGFEQLNEGVVLKPEITHLDSEITAPLMVKMPLSASLTFEEWSAKENV